MPIEQLLREWPPGFGGVERVAHELGTFWGGDVFSLDVQRNSGEPDDPLEVPYIRKRLSCVRLVGRFHLPLPSYRLIQLLVSTSPLVGHLPSPGILLLLLLARLLRPNRKVIAHWHCFLDETTCFMGFLFALYQWIALHIVRNLSAVITTSPVLSAEIVRRGCPQSRVFVLPCCISHKQEQMALSLPVPEAQAGKPLRLLFIGRLDSYKRLDWLFEALVQLSSSWHLVVVGDGPKRSRFEELASRIFPQPLQVRFLGRLSETAKFEQLAAADVLVLPSNCSNEAFGIVQLEAMASGRIALALEQPRSGMSWVSSLPGFSWLQSREGLSEVLQRLADHSALRQSLCVQARERYSTLFARRVWLLNLQRFSDLVEGGMVSNSVE